MQHRRDHGIEQIGIVSRRMGEELSILSGAKVLRFANEGEAFRFLRGFVSGGGRAGLGAGLALPAGDEALRALARRVIAGELLVLSSSRQKIAIRHERPIYATPREAARPASPPPTPSPRPETPPEEESMVPNPVAQAQVLESASQSGAPLCET